MCPIWPFPIPTMCPRAHPPSARPGNLSPPQHCHNIYSLIWGIHPSLFSLEQQHIMRKVSAANIISICLLIYYISVFFVFLFAFGRDKNTDADHREKAKIESPSEIIAKYGRSVPYDPDHWDKLSFLMLRHTFGEYKHGIHRYSIELCKLINVRYGTGFDCYTTPEAELCVPYSKLPLDEKIEVKTADAFNVAIGLFGRKLSEDSRRGIHRSVAIFLFSPLIILTVPPTLWRLLCRAWGRKQVMAERPIYRGVVGVFALVILVLAAAVVGVAMMDRPEGEKGTLSEAAIEAHGEMVRNLLN